MFLRSFLVLVCLPILSVYASINVIASVRGKKYEIEAETVSDFTAKVESVVNLEAGQQSVLFRGKVLSPEDVLSDVGVSPGDVLMVVKGRKARSKQDIDVTHPADLSPADSTSIPPNPFSKSLPGNAGDMENAMKQMDSLLDSNVFEEYFKDEDSLEKARLQLLQNLDQYDEAMPGFKSQAQEIASDPEKWRAAMLKAKDQIAMLREQRDKLRSQQPGPSTSLDKPNRYIFNECDFFSSCSNPIHLNLTVLTTTTILSNTEPICNHKIVYMHSRYL